MKKANLIFMALAMLSIDPASALSITATSTKSSEACIKKLVKKVLHGTCLRNRIHDIELTKNVFGITSYEYATLDTWGGILQGKINAYTTKRTSEVEVQVWACSLNQTPSFNPKTVFNIEKRFIGPLGVEDIGTWYEIDQPQQGLLEVFPARVEDTKGLCVSGNEFYQPTVYYIKRRPAY